MSALGSAVRVQVGVDDVAPRQEGNPVAQRKISAQLEWVKTRYSPQQLSSSEENRGLTERPTNQLVAIEAAISPIASLKAWPDAVRGIPNGFLRSALFGVVGKGKRRYLQGEEIASLAGIQIHYRGEKLDQRDLEVWACLMHLLRCADLRELNRISASAVLKLQGLTDTGKNHRTLQTRIARLRATNITIQHGPITFMGGFVDKAIKDGRDNSWWIKVSPEMRSLFNDDRFTYIDWDVRIALGERQLAKWLHGFYSSHAQPYAFHVATLLRLAGSENKTPRSGMQAIREALDALVEVFAAHGQPFRYSIVNNLVCVEKEPSSAQRRSLKKHRGGRYIKAALPRS